MEKLRRLAFHKFTMTCFAAVLVIFRSHCLPSVLRAREKKLISRLYTFLINARRFVGSALKVVHLHFEMRKEEYRAAYERQLTCMLEVFSTSTTIHKIETAQTIS